jgi:hypothetical protein
MADHAEKSVDPKLDQFLNKDLPTSAVREGVTATEEFADIDTKPISEKSKQQILYYIRKGATIDEAHKLVDIIERIEQLPADKAETLVKGLRAISNHGVDSTLVQYLIKELTHVTFNPNDKKRKRCAKKDKFINSCGSDFLNELFGSLGWISGIIVFGIYAMASWRFDYPNKFTIDEEKSNRDRKKPKTSQEGDEDTIIE